MNPSNPDPNIDREDDAVWDLLARAPAPEASPNFADNTVRAARLLAADTPWWKKLLQPAPLTSMIGAAAAITIAVSVTFNPNPATDTTPDIAAVNPPANTASIQEIAETEALLAAVDNLNQFTDQELATLIGF